MRIAKALFKPLLLLACAALGSTAGAVQAADFPSQPVRIVVPTPPGGGLDIMARALANALQARWAQPVIILNKPGAGTSIGAAEVAAAKPDGYTLLFGMDATFVSNTLLLTTLSYDPDKSFSPVSLLVRGDQFIIANKDLPANNLEELIELAKKKPGTLNFGSHAKGSPTHIAFELMNSREGLDMMHIQYPGIAPVMTALLAGDIQLSLVGGSVGGNLLQAGKIKALAATGHKRSAMFPALKTVAEQGYPYMESSVWYALAAPAGTPEDIVAKISRDVATILHDRDFEEKFVISKGMESVGSTPQELGEWIQSDLSRTAQMFKDAGITQDSIQ